jgi:hypothetical protein
MFRSKTLIPMLVSLALILNGVGGAMASVAMSTAGASVVKSVALKGEPERDRQQVAMQSGCHEHLNPATSVTSKSVSHRDVTGDMDADSIPTPGEGDPADCCKDSGCTCGCAQQSHVVMTAEFLVMPAISPASIPWEQLAAPLSPSLSKPVRPPIS